MSTKFTKNLSPGTYQFWIEASVDGNFDERFPASSADGRPNYYTIEVKSIYTLEFFDFEILDGTGQAMIATKNDEISQAMNSAALAPAWSFKYSDYTVNSLKLKNPGEFFEFSRQLCTAVGCENSS